MLSQLYTYAMIRSLYDREKDYIDTFWPFALKCLPPAESSMKLEDIRAAVEARYSLVIPLNSLQVILGRQRRKGLVVSLADGYSLTKKGVDARNALEFDRDVDRRINELIADAHAYLVQERSIVPTTTEDTENAIVVFIENNLEMLEEFINPERRPDALARSKRPLRQVEAALLDYFLDVERGKPSIFATLKDMIYGSIVSVIIQSKSFPNVSRQFQRTTVYLDTNIILGLLGLDFDEYNMAAQEMFQLLQSGGRFDFKVFDFTIDEFCFLLGRYKYLEHNYLADVKVNSVYSSLKSKGITPADIIELVAGIETQLGKYHIDIHQTGIKLGTYNPSDPEDRTVLSQFKGSQDSKGQDHDLAAIELVEQYRGKPARSVEQARAFFLTSDVRLARYNLVGKKHRETHTVTETILDRLLTSIMWLKNPDMGHRVSLRSIVAAHSRDLFIDNNVWKKFYTLLQNLRNEGLIKDEDASIFIYDNHTQGILRECAPEDVDRFDPGTLLKGIQVARKQFEGQAKEAEIELRRKYEKLAENQDQAHYRGLQDFVVATKEKLKTRATVLTGTTMSCLGIPIGFILAIAVLYSLPRIWSNPAYAQATSFVAGPTLGVISWIIWTFWGLRLKPNRVRSKLQDWLFSSYYRKLLRLSEIESLSARIGESRPKIEGKDDGGMKDL